MQQPIRLSRRQLEVARLIAEAKTAKEIATLLGCAEMTAERHTYDIGQVMHNGENFGPGLKIKVAVAYTKGLLFAE